jgi:hypothetical protein
MARPDRDRGSNTKIRHYRVSVTTITDFSTFLPRPQRGPAKNRAPCRICLHHYFYFMIGGKLALIPNCSHGTERAAFPVRLQAEARPRGGYPAPGRCGRGLLLVRAVCWIVGGFDFREANTKSYGYKDLSIESGKKICTWGVGSRTGAESWVYANSPYHSATSFAARLPLRVVNDETYLSLDISWAYGNGPSSMVSGRGAKRGA